MYIYINIYAYINIYFEVSFKSYFISIWLFQTGYIRHLNSHSSHDDIPVVYKDTNTGVRTHSYWHLYMIYMSNSRPDEKIFVEDHFVCASLPNSRQDSFISTVFRLLEHLSLLYIYTPLPWSTSSSPTAPTSTYCPPLCYPTPCFQRSIVQPQ